MKNQEAKFILGAYRPDGRDAGNAVFAPALAQAERDPDLQAWFEKQRKFDAALAAKLQSIAPPPELREAILAGARMSGRREQRHWWSRPIWLAAAAALVLAAIIGTVARRPAARPGGAELARFALSDLANAHAEHVGRVPELANVQAQIAGAPLPLTRGLALNLDELKKKNCRAVALDGRTVYEICFERDGTWYHVYVGRRSDFAPGTLDPRALLAVQGNYAATTWADATHVYALVTGAGAEALRRVI